MPIDDFLPFIPATPKKVSYFYAMVLIRWIRTHYVVDITANPFRWLVVEPGVF